MSDVWDTANEATLGPKMFFGQIFTDGFFVYISKGEPKVVFDPAQHPADKRFTQIKIDGVCTKQDGTTYEIAREIIAEFGREWAGIVLPSLKVCGVHPRDLNEKWARWEMVETGRTYTNDYGTQKATTFKFLEIYPDEAACRAAEAAYYSRPAAEAEPDLTEAYPMPEETPAPANDAQREVAAKFLPALWASAKGDVTKFSELLAGNPLTSKYFDLNSPEVAAIVAEAA